MRLLSLDRDYQEAFQRQRPKWPAESHVERTLSESTTVLNPDGNVIAILLRDVIPSGYHGHAFNLWWDHVKLPLGNRPKALGTESLPRSVNRAGIPSPRSGVNDQILKVSPARQAILGLGGKPLHKTKLTTQHPELIQKNQTLLRLVNKLYRNHAPSLYRTQRTQAKKHPFHFRHTAFTSIYLARSFRTAYHADSANLRGVLTALMPMGDFKGGELVLPRWRLAVAFRPGDLLLFDPQQIHGNLPIEGNRLSAAFYCAAC